MAAEAAIEERKKEVEAELGEQLKERSKEHEKHKYQEHEESFKALLIDLVHFFLWTCRFAHFLSHFDFSLLSVIFWDFTFKHFSVLGRFDLF